MDMLSVLATTLGEPQFHVLDEDMLDWPFPHLTPLTHTSSTLLVSEYALTTSAFKFHANLSHSTLLNFSMTYQFLKP